MDERVERMIADAYAAFDRWCREHDVDGDLSILERVEAYAKWCDEQKPTTQ